MKNKKVIVIAVAVLLIIAAFPCFNYLKTRVMWKNTFDLKYEGTYHSYGDDEIRGWEYTITNKTNDLYSLDYVYVYTDNIVKKKVVKIKIYVSLQANSNAEIRITKDDLLEALGLESVPIWGDISIKGFGYNKK